MNVFSLINNYGLIIKVFEDLSKPSPIIDAMMISYGCVYKRSSKPVMKCDRIRTCDLSAPKTPHRASSALGF